MVLFLGLFLWWLMAPWLSSRVLILMTETFPSLLQLSPSLTPAGHLGPLPVPENAGKPSLGPLLSFPSAWNFLPALSQLLHSCLSLLVWLQSHFPVRHFLRPLDRMDPSFHFVVNLKKKKKGHKNFMY